MIIKKNQQFQLFASYAISMLAYKFQSFQVGWFLIPGTEDALLVSLTKGSNLFDCWKMRWVSK